MPVLIDGNNLLFAARALEDPDRLFGRSMLCDALGKWAERTRSDVRIVFDGPVPQANLAAQIGHPHIETTYSGSGITADAVIIKILDTDSAARRITVVSTDREVAAAAKRRKAKPVRSEDFWLQVQRVLNRPRRPTVSEPEEKRHGLNSAETDEWLREFGMDD